MGDMAELYDEQYSECEIDVSEYFNNGAEWLVEHSAWSRKPIIISIRKQYKQTKIISEKQQWVLAFCVANKDAENI